MTTPYLKKLSKEGHGTLEHLEKEWDNAKKDAKKEGKENNYALVTTIFKKRVGLTSFLVEAAIPLSLYRPYKGVGNKNLYANIFATFAHTSRNNYRIYLPLSGSKAINDKVSETVPPLVKDYLTKVGFSLDNYTLGTAIDKHGRTVRLGKVLSKDPEAKKAFDSDPQRKGVTAQEEGKLVCVISRHPYDILGISFDRGWTSCMNLAKGVKNGALKTLIKEGALVAYLVRDNDLNINRPIARILLLPYKNSKGQVVFQASRKEYGSAPASFRKKVSQFTTWLGSKQPKGEYKVKPGLSKLNSDAYAINHKIKPSDLKGMSITETIQVAENPNTPVSILEILAKNGDWRVRSDVASNPNTPVALLEVLAKNGYWRVRSDVASNPNTPVALLEVLAKDEVGYVKARVAGNPNTPVALLEVLAKDEGGYVKARVAENPNTPVSVLKFLTKDKNTYVRTAARRALKERKNEK